MLNKIDLPGEAAGRGARCCAPLFVCRCRLAAGGRALARGSRVRPPAGRSRCAVADLAHACIRAQAPTRSASSARSRRSLAWTAPTPSWPPPSRWAPAGRAGGGQAAAAWQLGRRLRLERSSMMVQCAAGARRWEALGGGRRSASASAPTCLPPPATHPPGHRHRGDPGGGGAARAAAARRTHRAAARPHLRLLLRRLQGGPLGCSVCGVPMHAPASGRMGAMDRGRATPSRRPGLRLPLPTVRRTSAGRDCVVLCHARAAPRLPFCRASRHHTLQGAALQFRVMQPHSPLGFLPPPPCINRRRA